MIIIAQPACNRISKNDAFVTSFNLESSFFRSTYPLIIDQREESDEILNILPDFIQNILDMTTTWAAN